MSNSKHVNTNNAKTCKKMHLNVHELEILAHRFSDVSCAATNDLIGWMNACIVCNEMAWYRCVFENGAWARLIVQNATCNPSMCRYMVFHLWMNSAKNPITVVVWLDCNQLKITSIPTCVYPLVCLEMRTLRVLFVASARITSMFFKIGF